MKIDQLGRRLIKVPWVKTAARPVALDLTDFNFWQELATLLSSDTPIYKNLGIKSNYQHETFLRQHTQDKCFEAELFAHEFTFKSVGSSRHLERGRFLWKGVGRNQLALQEDLIHSSGTMSLEEGLSEFIYSQILGKELAVPVKGVFKYQSPENFPDSFLVRDMQLPRLASVPILATTKDSLKNIGLKLEAFFGVSGKEAWSKLILTFIHQHQKGFVHRSATTANFDIAGRSLDLSGSKFFPGEGLEIFQMQKETPTNPLESIFWMIEKYYLPLYSSIWNIPHLELEKIQKDLFHEHFNHIHSNKIEFEQNDIKDFFPWVVLQSKSSLYKAPQEDLGVKIQKLLLALSGQRNPADQFQIVSKLMSQLHPQENQEKVSSFLGLTDGASYV